MKTEEDCVTLFIFVMGVITGTLVVAPTLYSVWKYFTGN